MHETSLITSVLFFGSLLVLTTLLKGATKRSGFPYTIAIMAAGFLTQVLITLSGSEFSASLSPDFIFFVLLPLLLFESASMINTHQFKLQFRTVTFLATFGLLISIGIVGVITAWLLELPLGVGLLFGAIISATDPIAVLSIFKSLGAPKRLAMLAEGESMFNDATAVIVFRVISTIVVAESVFGSQTILSGMSSFAYVFAGSLVVGALLGWLTSLIIERVENDRIIETTLTVALALMSFGIAEHFLQLSGVISTVAAGITLSSIGKTRISGPVAAFMHEFWEYVGFLSVSLVFFFAAFSLDTLLLWRQPLELVVVIGSVLLARSASVHITFWISNNLPFFDREPNVPLSWQNVLNWGGLRGVIPLVLVYSLPETFVFREVLVGYTLVVFVYSLIVHGLSIKWVLHQQKLDRPEKESLIVQEEMRLLDIEESLDQIDTLPEGEFDANMIHSFRLQLVREAERHQQQLVRLAKADDLLKSLQLQSISIERESLHALFQLGHITEATVLEFEGELDLQQDAIEYPEVSQGRGFSTGGKVATQTSFRKNLAILKKRINQLPWLGDLIRINKRRLITERIQLLKARIISSDEVIRYLEYITHFFSNNKEALGVIDSIKGTHMIYKRENKRELDEISNDYPHIFQEYQQRTLQQLVLG